MFFFYSQQIYNKPEHPLDETHLVAVRVLMRLRSFNKVRQWGDLNWASQLQPSGLTDLLNCSTSYLLQSNYCQAVSTWSTLTVLLIFGFNKCICFLAIHIKCYWRYRSLLKSRSRIHLWVSSNISIRQISINYLERGRAPEIPQKRISSKKPFLTLENVCLSVLSYKM